MPFRLLEVVGGSEVLGFDWCWANGCIVANAPPMAVDCGGCCCCCGNDANAPSDACCCGCCTGCCNGIWWKLFGCIANCALENWIGPLPKPAFGMLFMVGIKWLGSAAAGALKFGLNWLMAGADAYNAIMLSLVILAFSFSVGIWLKKSCSSWASDEFGSAVVAFGVEFTFCFVSLATLLVGSNDDDDDADAGGGPLRKHVNTSLLLLWSSAPLFFFASLSPGWPTGDDRPSKSELMALISAAEATLTLLPRDLGLLELVCGCGWNEMEIGN